MDFSQHFLSILIWLPVFGGIALLAIVYFKGLGGKYGPDDYWGVEGAVKWWHFVDVAWVFIYPTLYLVNT